MNTQHAITSFHARLLVILAEHHAVVSRHLLDDAMTVECSCGNPLYTGHIVTLIRRLGDDQAAEHDQLIKAVQRLHTEWGNTEDVDQLVWWERLGKILHPATTAAGVES